MRFSTVRNLAQRYDTSGQGVSDANIRRIPAIRNFKAQQKASKDRRKDKEVKTLNTRKNLPATKYPKYFADFLHRLVVLRTNLLSHAARESSAIENPY